MKFKIADKIFYRVPQFPLNASLEECWQELKQSIALSSPDFYKEIKEISFEDSRTLPLKHQQTIFKYFNRSKYRPIPFGTFAAIGLIDPNLSDNTEGVLLADTQSINGFLDWSYKDQLSYQFEDVVKEDCLLFTNSTYYAITDVIRYIFKNDDGFELAEITKDQKILDILYHCSKPIHLSDLFDQVAQHFNSKNDYHNLLEELIMVQLLITSKDPNIIGEDYFERLGIAASPDTSKYVIAERKYCYGTVDKKLLSHLPELVILMAHLHEASDTTANLKKFKERYSKRFDRQEIPLMVALDPEFGLGYGQLESPGDVKNSITEFLSMDTFDKKNSLNELKAKLVSQLPPGIKSDCIKLDQLFDISSHPFSDYKVANSISALVQVIDGKLLLSHLGGFSTNQFAGRFSLGSKEIYKYCKETAEFEQNANPDVLFFDIGYMAENKVDNVNRRNQIYPYQLSILNYDTSPDPLMLHDMMVSVKNNEVVLRSQKLNKRLIPRLATAYNYGRSDLSVFRFLCDLCVQDLITNMSLNVSEIQPGLSYYPRIQFHNIIVSPAIWNLSAQEFNHHPSDHLGKIDSFLFSKAIPRYIKFGVSDQTLLLDLQKPEDKTYLESQIKRNQNLKIEEAFIPGNSIITDSAGKPFLGQLLLSLRHQNTVYSGLTSNEKPTGAITRNFLPGSEWLYFEIYCHPLRGDELLHKLKVEFILVHNLKIKRWFFIRYNENGDHLRLRLRLNDLVDAGYMMEALNVLLYGEISSGLIADVQVKTYKREIERYGESLMDVVEEHFFKDSNYVLDFLSENTEDFQKYLSCLQIFDGVIITGLFDSVELSNWIKKVHSSFVKEHRLNVGSFKRLNNFLLCWRRQL